jgi:hypothetical protein
VAAVELEEWARRSSASALVRLIPSGAATHPRTGALGDLFLDRNERLWFRKGGTTWKQIA